MTKDRQRFHKQILPDHTKTTIVYRVVEVAGKQAELSCDLYEPDGDLAQTRPLLIMITGGGFIQRTDHFNPHAAYFTKLGYAVAVPLKHEVTYTRNWYAEAE